MDASRVTAAVHLRCKCTIVMPLQSGVLMPFSALSRRARTRPNNNSADRYRAIASLVLRAVFLISRRVRHHDRADRSSTIGYAHTRVPRPAIPYSEAKSSTGPAATRSSKIRTQFSTGRPPGVQARPGAISSLSTGHGTVTGHVKSSVPGTGTRHS